MNKHSAVLAILLLILFTTTKPMMEKHSNENITVVDVNENHRPNENTETFSEDSEMLFEPSCWTNLGAMLLSLGSSWCCDSWRWSHEAYRIKL